MFTCGHCKHRLGDGWCAVHRYYTSYRERSCRDFTALKLPKPSRRDALIQRVADAYNRGDKLEVIARDIGYSVGGTSGIVAEAYRRGLVEEMRGKGRASRVGVG